jgi:hypothetical protein
MNEKSTLNVLRTMFHDLMDLVLDPSTWGGSCTESIRPWAQKTWLVKFWWSNSDFLITSFNGGFTNLLSYFFYKILFIYLKVGAKFICSWAEKVVIVQIIITYSCLFYDLGWFYFFRWRKWRNKKWRESDEEKKKKTLNQ